MNYLPLLHPHSSPQTQKPYFPEHLCTWTCLQGKLVCTGVCSHAMSNSHAVWMRVQHPTSRSWRGQWYYTDANSDSKHKADVVEWEKEDTDGQNTPKQLNDLKKQGMWGVRFLRAVPLWYSQQSFPASVSFSKGMWRLITECSFEVWWFCGASQTLHGHCWSFPGSQKSRGLW